MLLSKTLESSNIDFNCCVSETAQYSSTYGNKLAKFGYPQTIKYFEDFFKLRNLCSKKLDNKTYPS